MSDDLKQFTAQLINVQSRLRAVLMVLLADRDAMEDVLQETNAVLWDKRGEFEPGTNFNAWACKVAYYEVLNYRKRKRRSFLHAGPQVLDDLAAVSSRMSDDYDRRERALHECMDGLSEEHRQLVRRRYAEEATLTALAESLGRPVESLYTTLYRIRRAMADCIQQKLEADPA